MKKCYIIIPQYLISDELEMLSRNAIRSFKNTADCTVISVDDGGTQGAEMLKKESDIYIKNEKNLGFGPTCNKGFRRVLEHEENAYIVCANNDIEVFECWLDEFTEVMKLPNAGMVGGLGYRTRVVEGRPIQDYRSNPGSPFGWDYISDGGLIRDWLFPGGFFMTTADLFRKVGVYDEGFVHGGYEDIDLFIRVQKAGLKLMMTSRVLYWHKEGATRFSEQEKGFQSNAEPKNRQYFADLHGFDAHENMMTIFKDNRINN